ncbi:POK9 protein, partial [Centropus bengalensis]|nr:POK9 protein [Centropus bengalensis]
RGSLGLDLATAVEVTLIDTRPQRIPTRVMGPIVISGQPHGALLLGRSSSGLKGLFILPGIIDSDFTGEICIVAQTNFPPIYIPKGSRIAQLVPLQQLTTQMTSDNTPVRGPGCFGSTEEMILLTVPLNQRPVAHITLIHGSEQKQVVALLDTGADITIVS